MGNCCISRDGSRDIDISHDTIHSKYRDSITKTKAIPIRKTYRTLIPPAHSDYKDKLTIVLDLDETLVCGRNIQLKHESEIPGDDLSLLIRPYTLELIYACKSWGMEIVVWSAGLKYYVLAALHHLLLGRLELIDHIIWRDTRWHPINATETVPKDLTLLGRDLSKTIIIDNHPINILSNFENGILVPDFDDTMLERQFFKGGDESLSDDYTFLGLITTIHSINRSYGGNHRDVRYIIEKMADDPHSYLKEWRYLDKKCYFATTLMKNQYIDAIENGAESSELVRFVASDYPQICETLQILTPKIDILNEMEKSYLPLSPMRTHLTINPYLIEKRYETMRLIIMCYYEANPSYNADSYNDLIGAEFPDSREIRKSTMRIYGTF